MMLKYNFGKTRSENEENEKKDANIRITKTFFILSLTISFYLTML